MRPDNRANGRGAPAPAASRRRFEALLKRFVAGRTSRRAERALVELHLRHFQRRVRVLDPCFFPGRERSDDAIVSLGHGAFVDFASAPDFDDGPAFRHAIHAPLPALPFLYYWRASATIRFLRKHGSAALRARLKVLRNVRIHLREGFVRIDTPTGEPRWALPEWTAVRGLPMDLRAVQVDLRGVRGKAAIRAILAAVGAPLTRCEIAGIMLRCPQHAAPIEVQGTREMVADDPPPDARLHQAAVRARVERIFAQLSADDVALLRARGYTSAGQPRVSYPAVARQLGRLSAESWRLKERRILEIFREHFDPDEAALAVSYLLELLDAP